MPHRAYDLIWNEFYRDEDLQTALTVSLGDGTDNTTAVALQNICWEKDYLTSSRPWVLKGPSITLPLGTTAPIKGIGFYGTSTGTDNPQATVRETGSGTANYAHGVSSNIGTGLDHMIFQTDSAPGAATKPQIFADLSNATAIDINSVRYAFARQRFEEARARYGSRYVEYLRYLGVRCSDARLQRPEYIS